MPTALFIFRRDLRVADNTGLIDLAKDGFKIIPVFIFDPKQIGSRNKYRSERVIDFMCESLNDLEGQIARGGGHLQVLEGDPVSLVREIVRDHDVSVIGFTRDYTPYAKQRDARIAKIAETRIYDDITLHPVGEIISGSGGAYKKFSPFKAASMRKRVREPKVRFAVKWSNVKLCTAADRDRLISPQGTSRTHIDDGRLVHGGRREALHRLQKIPADYGSMRNYLAAPTSLMSAYNKFGCVSIRELWAASGGLPKASRDSYRNELLWRDFYYNLVDSYGLEANQPAYDKVKWRATPAHIRAWKKGETGVDIVDAAMKQLDRTGYMPNRARMIVASYLIMILGADWRIGERHFAQQLTDYDPCQNNGGWQWSAGCGYEAQPYFRVFNPELQAQKFDPDGEYRKKWLKGRKKKEPIVDYAEAKEAMQKAYKRALN